MRSTVADVHYRDTLEAHANHPELNMATKPKGLHSFPLRIDDGLRRRLTKLADLDGRKVSELARDLLRTAVENRLLFLNSIGETQSVTIPHEEVGHDNQALQ